MKFFQILMLISLVLGCAHSTDGQASKEAPAKSKNETLSSGKTATEAPVPSKEPLTQAKTPSALKDQVVLDLIKKYKSETPVMVKIRKRVKSPYLVKEKVSSGELKLGKDIFRMDMAKPDNSVMVLDGKNIWLETRLDPEMGGAVQVSKFSMNETRRANAVFAVLFDNRNLHDGFELVEIKDDPSKGKTFVYKPKTPAVDYKQLSISIRAQKNQLSSFSYEDELENQVIYDFGQTEFHAKIKNWQLEYTPPKGVKPSEF